METEQKNLVEKAIVVTDAPDPDTDFIITKEMGDHLERLKSHFVTHRTLERCESNTLSLITYAEPGCMSVIVGPTGVGKTTLLRNLAAKLAIRLGNEGGGKIPVVLIEFKANEEIKFSWKDFYHRILSITDKALANEVLVHPNGGILPSHRASVNVIRRLTEASLKRRETRVVLVDEAHHVAMGVFAKELADQMEVLKSFANMTGVHLVLCGPYQLLRPLQSSGQLARRGTLIHFPRYRVNVKDLEEFGSVVANLAEHMKPWTFDFEIQEITQYIYERTLGLVGLLKPWFLLCVERCAENGSWVITRDILDQTAKGPNELKTILREMLKGEEQIIGTKKDWAELSAMLNLGFDPGPTKEEKEAGETPEVPPKQQHRPGERAPKRDASSHGIQTQSS